MEEEEVTGFGIADATEDAFAEKAERLFRIVSRGEFELSRAAPFPFHDESAIAPTGVKTVASSNRLANFD